MKKLRFAGLALLAPLTMLCACADTPTLSFSSGWYANTSLTSDIGGTDETLNYKVTFLPSTQTDGLTVTYEDGTYTTSLKSELREMKDGTKETVYILTTDLAMSGNYAWKGTAGEKFNDNITTTTVFRSAEKGLAPISTVKVSTTTAPTTAVPEGLKGSYATFKTKYEAEYDLSLKSAVVKITDMSEENANPVSTTVDMEDVEGSYLDNDVILFALRGLDLSVSHSFTSINPISLHLDPVASSASTAETMNVKDIQFNGEKKEVTINVNHTSISYQTDMPGATQDLWYAKTVSPSANTYRNVLLRMEVPLTYNMGTLRYSLTSATFTK